MQLQDLGKFVVLAGLGIVVLGIVLFIGGRLGLGSLPGDIRFERGGWSCFFPIVSMIVVSIVLTVLLNLVLRLFR